MTTQELDALQGLCDGATAGSWVVVGAYNQFVDSAPDSDNPRTIIAEAWQRNAMMEQTAQGRDDLAFIAAARTAMPALIAEVRRLTERCEAAEADLKQFSNCLPCAHYKPKGCGMPCKRYELEKCLFKWRGPAPDDNA